MGRACHLNAPPEVYELWRAYKRLGYSGVAGGLSYTKYCRILTVINKTWPE